MSQWAYRLQLRLLVAHFGGGGIALGAEALQEHIRLLGRDNILLLGLGGIVELKALLGAFFLLGGLGLLILFLQDAQHHPLHLAEFIVVLLEDGLGAGDAAEIEVLDAAVQNCPQLFKGLVALSCAEAYAFFNYLADPAAGGLGCGKVSPAHAPEMGVVTLTLQRKLTAGKGIVHQHAHRVHIRGCRQLALPVYLRGGKVLLLPLQRVLPGRAETDGAVFVDAYILRKNAAAPAPCTHLKNHLAAEGGDELAQFLLIHFAYLYA